jgi:AcrR family transcriptional regulator/DNA-binding MarR family transcriptional regulator
MGAKRSAHPGGHTPSEGAAPNGVARDGVPRPGVPRDGARTSGLAYELGRERVLEIQRARILAAMVEVSVERGAANATVAHVVERAGVSRRTFYELFADREACFLGAFDDAFARATRYVLDAYDPNAKWVERTRTALIAVLRFLDVDRAAGQLLIVGSLGAGHQALERRRRGIAQIIALVDEGRNQTKAGAELPHLTAEGIVGGILSVLHSRLIDPDGGSLLGLTGPLMGMIVLPYLGPAAARRENAIPIPKNPPLAHHLQGNPLGRLEMRLTYRTVRVLMAIAANPGSSNRVVAETAEVTDQGQMSKLLARLQGLGLIENAGGGATRGEPNAWTLTDKGWRVQGALAEQRITR